MDKNAIKKYAVWAREQLIEKVTARAVKYEIIDGKELNETLEAVGGEILSEAERKQRKALIQKIKADGYSQVMEEVAYTWFNRFVAIRFMEVNGYLPSHVRVFSDESGAFKPQILAEAIHLDLDGLDMNKVMQFKEDANEEELFKYLLKIQCNALNEILPQMFQKIEDYTELLLPDFLLREGSVIEKLVNEIPEDNFDVNTENGQIEVIGWMYQYYISAKHEEVVDPLHGKVVKKEEVPAATQLFTTDWVVRYLIDNSVGRYWVERNPESKLADELTYFVKPKNGVTKNVDEKIIPQDVTVFDPCVGSGHFLVYAFDVLMKIYVEYGYSERDAAAEIVKNNLFGLDIDGRAGQLAYFAVMMKARQYDRRFLSKEIQPNVYEIIESNALDRASIEHFYENDSLLKKDIGIILNAMKDAKEYGSILQMIDVNYSNIDARFEQLKDEISMYRTYLLRDFHQFIRAVELMGRKYAVVATNPPYLNKYDDKLKKYIIENYNDYKGDLFSVFMYKCREFCIVNGYMGYMTPNVWMFTASYENLRNFVLDTISVSTLVQMAKGAFFKEATVDVCAFVLGNKHEPIGTYFRLESFKGDMEVQQSAYLNALTEGEGCSYVYRINKDIFSEITGRPLAYWISEKMRDAFIHYKTIGELAPPKQGMATGKNEIFLRMWYEVSEERIGFNMHNSKEALESKKKWFPYNKGGAFRRWYGNRDYVVDWENDGVRIKNFKDENGKLRSAPKNLKYDFCECITWSDITSALFSGRYCEGGFKFDTKGSSGFPEHSILKYILGFLNSTVSQECIHILNPTITTQVGDMARIPVVIEPSIKDRVDNLVSCNIRESKEDWDSYETSWDYETHPFIKIQAEELRDNNVRVTRISECYQIWESRTNKRFNDMKRNEEELNRIFIDLYGLQSEMSAELDDKDITVSKAELSSDIKSFISYAVGCILGRYSLENWGLAYAGGEWDSSKYKTFIPDADGIIPISDDEYFSDDIVGRFVSFVEVVYGKDTLEDNLKFIADALGGKGTSREIIRNYFMNDFYTDHVKIYQKRPIYWLFDSGKKNGFKCLIYMHRYQPDTIARIRTDYVHEQQARYRTAIEETTSRLENASGSDKVKLTKKLNTLKAQNDEIHAYEEKIHHLADQMISIDLDDGVKKNYEIFKDVLAKIK